VLHAGQANYACGLIGYQGSEWHEPNTLAQCLADAGYHCINVGWRNMHPRRKLYGFHNVITHDLRDGVDDYADWLRERLGPDAHERAHGSDANGWLGRPWHLDERYHATNWTVAETVRQIERRDPTRPFFVWCSHLRPHSPYDPPQFFWDMYMEKNIPRPPIGDWAASLEAMGGEPVPNQPGIARRAWRGELTPEQDRRMRAGYMACITHIDYQLGYLEERLAGMQLLPNTLFLFTADHGDMMGDHYMHRKCYAYEGSARIPFVVRYAKGMDLPTGTFEDPVGLQDVMPTLLEAAGAPIPDSVTGKSVLAAARGEPWREFFHGEHSPCYELNHGMHYVTDGKEKYIWYVVTGEEQFFDLTKDRDELRDLSTDPASKDRVALWRKRLIDLLAERGDGFSDGKQLLGRKEWYGPVAGT